MRLDFLGINLVRQPLLPFLPHPATSPLGRVSNLHQAGGSHVGLSFRLNSGGFAKKSPGIKYARALNRQAVRRSETQPPPQWGLTLRP